VAFVIDVFARRIVRWRVSASLRTDFVSMRSSRPFMSGATRGKRIWSTTANTRYDDPLNPRQDLSMRYTDRLAEAGIEPSVGSRGDSYDYTAAGVVGRLTKRCRDVNSQSS
jgi:transposase InsO family protein